MANNIPRTSFRLETGFAVAPDLVGDAVAGAGLLMGQNAPSDELEAVYIGKQAETPYQKVWMDTRGAHVVYVMGKRRSGKSYTLGVLAEGLAAESWIRQGSSRHGLLVLDTMNVFMTMRFAAGDVFAEESESVRELRKWALPNDGLSLSLYSPRGTSPPAELGARELSLRPSDLAPEEWCGLFSADPFADPLGHLISELYGKVAEDGYTPSGQPNAVPPNAEFSIDELLEALERDPDLGRFHRDTRESLRRRLRAIRRLPIFSATGLDVRDLLQPGQVSVLLLRDLDQALRAVLVALLVKKIMQLRAISEQEERMEYVARARAQKYRDADPARAERELELANEHQRSARLGLPRSWIVIDEAHNYVPAQGFSPSRAPLIKYVKEGRNLGLSIVVATQQPSSLDPALQRNADMLLVHALSHSDDIHAAEGMINTATPTSVTLGGKERIEGNRSFHRLVRALPVGYALASTDRANRLFPVRVRPRMTVHGGPNY